MKFLARMLVAVLGAAEAALHQREARVHEEHQHAGDQHPHRVDADAQVAAGRGELVEQLLGGRVLTERASATPSAASVGMARRLHASLRAVMVPPRTRQLGKASGVPPPRACRSRPEAEAPAQRRAICPATASLSSSPAPRRSALDSSVFGGSDARIVHLAVVLAGALLACGAHAQRIDLVLANGR